jgi:hypothetical protein
VCLGALEEGIFHPGELTRVQLRQPTRPDLGAKGVTATLLPQVMPIRDRLMSDVETPGDLCLARPSLFKHVRRLHPPRLQGTAIAVRADRPT